MKFLKTNIIPLSIIFLFIILYSVLSIVKHLNYGSGYDLAVSDQFIWQFSRFKPAITTIHSYPFTSIFADHFELIFLLISPIFWIWDNAISLILLQNILICLSALPIFLLAQRKGISKLLSIVIMFSYLSFYGIQNAVWSDVHSIVFAASFLPWFVFFLDVLNYEKGKTKLAQTAIKCSAIFFFLSIISKEDIALLTFLISLVFFLSTRKKINKAFLRINLIYAFLSLLYIAVIFGIFYPNFTPQGYRFASSEGILSDLNPFYMVDTKEKVDTIFYSLGWFGGLPLLAPLYLIPALGDLAHYFVLGHKLVSSAQSIFGHYRVTMALFMAWPTIIVISKFKFLNNRYVTVYLLLSAFLVQYLTHSPLSYLSKRWFWTQSSSVQNINKLVSDLPRESSVASQINIIPHIAHRDNVFTIWPTTRGDIPGLKCEKKDCRWLSWYGNPKYLLVDTSPDWDIRHLLANRPDFIEGLNNLEKVKSIKVYKREGNATLYTIEKKIK